MTSVSFVSQLALVGIGSLAFATLTPQPTLAAPAITLKASFEGTNVRGSFAALTPAGNGLFYGTTVEGGDNGGGSIFEFDPSGGGSITLKASIFADKAASQSALTPAGNGLFYGTTVGGGDNDLGSIFEFDPSGGGSITLKASFDGANGVSPYAALTPAGNGLFYGTTIFGDNGFGSIFEFDPTPGAPVPGPLPLMGAAAALGWSRRLRRRIQQVRARVPDRPLSRDQPAGGAEISPG